MHLLGKLRGVVIDFALLMCKVHWAILAIVEDGAAGPVDGQHAKVGTNAILLCILIRKEPAAQEDMQSYWLWSPMIGHLTEVAHSLSPPLIKNTHTLTVAACHLRSPRLHNSWISARQETFVYLHCLSSL